MWVTVVERTTKSSHWQCQCGKVQVAAPRSKASCWTYKTVARKSYMEIYLTTRVTFLHRFPCRGNPEHSLIESSKLHLCDKSIHDHTYPHRYYFTYVLNLSWAPVWMTIWGREILTCYLHIFLLRFQAQKTFTYSNSWRKNTCARLMI